MTPATTVAPPPLSLFHTAQAHVASCEAILAELAPDLPVRHEVRAELLATAIAAGALTAEVHAEAAAALEAQAGTAGLVLCTCSTLGPAAWTAAARASTPILRIDEPMARQAVATGPRIGIAACVATTIAPTRELLATVADRDGRSVQLSTILIDDAWPLFEAGDQAGYVRRIAEALRAQQGVDVVVLAQASMAPAAAAAGLPIPVLSSPRSGLAAAVSAFRARYAGP